LFHGNLPFTTISIQTMALSRQMQIVPSAKNIRPNAIVVLNYARKGIDMKTAIVTGASGAIGQAIATQFALNGYNVVLHYHQNNVQAETLASNLRVQKARVLLVQADLSTFAGAAFLVQQTIAAFGRIDVLINNAGISQFEMVLDSTEASYQSMMDINFKSVVACSKYATPHMIAQHSGKIINISSVWGSVGASCESVYAASKGSINAFSRSLAKELGGANICVNTIAPGMIASPMNGRLSTEEQTQIAQETPLKRLGTPEDVANAALFLASDQASFITGQTLTVDGGWQL